MKETTQSPDGTPETANGLDQELAVDQQTEDVVKYDTYRKVLNQRYKLKEERDDLNKQLDELRQRELEQQGKYREQAEIYKQKADEYQRELDNIRKRTQFDSVASVIKSKLSDKGVRNPEKAFKYAYAVNQDDLGRIVLTEDGTPDPIDVDRFVDKFLTDNVDMNFVSKPGVSDMPPTNNVQMGGEAPKNASKMTQEQLDAAWSSLK